MSTKCCLGRALSSAKSRRKPLPRSLAAVKAVKRRHHPQRTTLKTRPLWPERSTSSHQSRSPPPKLQPLYLVCPKSPRNTSNFSSANRNLKRSTRPSLRKERRHISKDLRKKSNALLEIAHQAPRQASYYLLRILLSRSSNSHW